MTRTLADLRAEKGLYLKDIATEIGVSEDELKEIEDSGVVPYEIASKLIEIYYLPDDYFTIDTSLIHLKNPKNPTAYFTKVSIVYYLITALISSVPIYIFAFSTVLKLNFELPSIFSAVWNSAISLLGCICLANYVLKKTVFRGNIKNFQFLHYTHTSGVAAALSIITGMITSFTYNEESGVNSTFFVWQGVNCLLSLLSIAFIIMVNVKLFKISISEDETEKRKSLKKLAIIITGSVAIAFILTIISMMIQGEFSAFVIMRRLCLYGLYALIGWLVTVVKPGDNKGKLVYTVLPILTIVQGLMFSFAEIFI